LLRQVLLVWLLILPLVLPSPQGQRNREAQMFGSLMIGAG
jgi:hypothetical protein